MIIISFIMISVGVALLPHLAYLLVKLISLVGHFSVAYRPFGYTALGLVVVWLVIFCWGYFFGRYFHETKEVTISCKGLPEAYDGFRIVQISDLHLNGWEGHEDKVLDIVKEINALEPDVIVFTGDLVSFDESELKPFIPVLSQLKSPNGVISIMGNHDYIPYQRSLSDRERASKIAELQRMEKEDLGWKLLLNENTFVLPHGGEKALNLGSISSVPNSDVPVSESAPSLRERAGGEAPFLYFIGCENQSMGVHNVISRGDLKKASEGTEDGYPVILTHDPTHWRGEIVKGRPSLTLSGHTHAGQFRVLGWSVARFIYNEYDGLYTEGDHNLYVNIGLGGAMPMRIGATPEISVITLKTK
ncbi:MAG: metallophosphoesterase [Prevotellaceae bacterium]|nr:metallophosphoesterase [Prevotellaceae bacterium]